MPGNDRKFGVTLIWAIENFDESFKGNLVSPVFLSNSLNNTEWQISIFPTGCSEDDDYISLILTRCDSDDKGIDRIIIDCELSIVDLKGSSLELMEEKNHGFVRGHSWSCQNFASRNDVFALKKSEFLPLGILTVRCRMWRRNNEITKTELRYSQTAIERCCFPWTIKDFRRLKAHQKKKIHVKRTQSETPILTFELFFEAGSDEARIEITPTAAENRVFELTCSISVLNSIGKIFKFRVVSHSFKLPHQTWQFPSFITKSALVKNKNFNLPMGVLSLKVKCFFWTGCTKNDAENIQHIEIRNFQVSEELLSTPKSDKQCNAETLYYYASQTQTSDKQCMTENLSPILCDKQSMTETKIIKPDHPTACNVEEVVETETSNGHRDHGTCQGFFLDMQGMFEEGFLSDFNLRAGNKTFQVHKNILSARSPVFRAMFTTAMKEKEGDIIDIPDVDEDTLQRMLVFVYLNKIEDLNWESAMNLYFAADKYAIDDLKHAMCSSLKSGLSASNACEILVHADLHEDQDLKSTALEFIVSHDKEIVGTEYWKIFQKKHIHLTVEILSYLYTKKMKS